MKIRKPRVKKPETPPYQGKIRTIEIEESLSRFFDVRKCIIVPNISWGLPGMHEADVFVITKSGCAYEIEIKISFSDFKADLKKHHEHQDRYNRIREFYYAMPKELVDKCKDLIPAHAGIISCERDNWKGFVKSTIVRKATVNTKARKLTEDEIHKVTRLSVYRIWSLKKKIIILQNEIHTLKEH